MIIDGDHNYFTVREELRLIGERAPGAELPLLLFHDVGWPHARRDDYHDADAIPAEHRHPVAGAAAACSPASRACAPARCRTRARPRTRAARATACSPRSRTSSPSASACGSSSSPCSSASAWSGIWTRRGRTRSRALLDAVGPQPGARAAGGQPRAAHRQGRSSCCAQRAARQEAVLRRMLESRRSRSPSGCRSCACGAGSRRRSRSSRGTRSVARSTTGARAR